MFFPEIMHMFKQFFVILHSDLASCHLQDIVGKQKAFAIISRSAKSLGNFLEIT